MEQTEMFMAVFGQPYFWLAMICFTPGDSVQLLKFVMSAEDDGLYRLVNQSMHETLPDKRCLKISPICFVQFSRKIVKEQ